MPADCCQVSSVGAETQRNAERIAAKRHKKRKRGGGEDSGFSETGAWEQVESAPVGK